MKGECRERLNMNENRNGNGKKKEYDPMLRCILPTRIDPLGEYHRSFAPKRNENEKEKNLLHL